MPATEKSAGANITPPGVIVRFVLEALEKRRNGPDKFK